jgi:hypothetical protein
MKYLTVPTQINLPRYRFRIALSGVIFTMRLNYNSRMERFSLDVADAQGTDLVVGLPVLISRDLTGQYVITGLPSGNFFATDDSNTDSQPTIDSFQIDHTLFYADPELS